MRTIKSVISCPKLRLDGKHTGTSWSVRAHAVFRANHTIIQPYLAWSRGGWRILAAVLCLAAVAYAPASYTSSKSPPGTQPSSSAVTAIENTSHERRPPNILVLIADDMGIETLDMYGLGHPTAVTPTLESLAQSGIRFNNFWAEPACSPTRAAILTGRLAHRTGVDAPIMFQWHKIKDRPDPVIPDDAHKELEFWPLGVYPADKDLTLMKLPFGFELGSGPAPSEILLPEALKRLSADYATAAIGKWHLVDMKNGGLDHPNKVGFDHYSGTLMGSPRSYFAWRHVENGHLYARQGYVDEVATKDAIDWIGAQRQPWFLWLAFINPHTPIHLPPRHLLHSDARQLDPDELTADNTQPYLLAQIEAMDTLIGRLLENIPADELDNTYIIFLGDNGTSPFSQPPAPRDPDRVKGTVYQGGVNVPLIIAGPGIRSGGVTDSVTHAVDLFATIIGMAGGRAGAILPADLTLDSISMLPLLTGVPGQHRQTALSHIDLPWAKTAAQDGRYKLVRKFWRTEFYDLQSDPHERDHLRMRDLDAAQKAAYQRLLEEVNKY